VSNVIDLFAQRSNKAEPAQDIGPAPTVPTVPTVPSEEVTIMLVESAAMTVIATLAFYAGQGWDGGKKAREAAPALQQLLATKGVKITLPPA
jgi:hypothetical protein